jgi:hypothetical protein
MTGGICIRTETLTLNGICPANYLVIRAATGSRRLSETFEHGLLVRSIAAAWTRTEGYVRRASLDIINDLRAAASCTTRYGVLAGL